tara:strand:+ start:504 stop:983 length:480 start_codon:yes stop_codon:yes gene_type:complete
MNNDTPRPIGRPKKIKPVKDEEVPHQLYFGPDMDFNDISKKIADDLGINQGQMSDKLAGAGLAYLSLFELKKNASLIRKTPGNRPHIHTWWLLIDCAEILHVATGIDGKAELSRIGPWNEHKSTIIRHAKVVLSALGLPHHHSMQQQARNAAKRMPIHA